MLLFRELVDKTDASHADINPLREALLRAQELGDLVNRGLMETESMKKLSDLRRNISGLQSLASPTRTLIKEGPACLMTPKKPYQLLLFNDLLVFAVKDDVRWKKVY